MTRRPRLLVLAIAVLALVVAVPALAGQHSTPPGQAKDKVAKVEITISGTIEQAAAAEGRSEYTLADGGTTYVLSAGPPWFFAAGEHPLDPFVGESVTIVGEHAEGSNEVDVISVNGLALRAEGKPPWAGGWKRVGESHPGWSQEKADRMKAKFGDCFPPGQCKDKPEKGADEDETADD
jgi:hypothetical protein